MKTEAADPETQRKLYAGFPSPFGVALRDAFGEIAAIANFELSGEASKPFVEFVQWINTRPAFIAHWRSDPVSERREYLRFMTVSDGARSAYAAACYHLGRLKEIEASVDAVLERYNVASQTPLSAAAVCASLISNIMDLFSPTGGVWIIWLGVCRLISIESKTPSKDSERHYLQCSRLAWQMR